jgi:hypothetical protein
MAGTIVSDTIQNGAGANTTTTNVINGSAKAWVNYKGTATRAINGSYNVSSVTFNSTGDYTINFTTSFADTNFATTLSAVTNNTSTTVPNVATNPTSAMVRTSTASSVTVNVFNVGFAAQADPLSVCVAIHR